MLVIIYCVIITQKVKIKYVKLSLYRPRRSLGLREVDRHSAHRWLQGCQPYAPAAFYPQKIPGTHFC
jgi:hypothetical protein